MNESAISLFVGVRRLSVTETTIRNKAQTFPEDTSILLQFKQTTNNNRGMANNMVNSLFFLAALLFYATDAFAPNSRTLSFLQSSSLGAASTSTAISASADEVQASVSQLKRVLEREYISFFDPMRTEYYAKDVTFDDPMTSLSGVASYQKNVDMLAGRTLMGKVLFDDAGIILHSVTGGEVLSDSNNNNINIQDITTCWTLKVTAKVIPWKPTAIFSGISVYKVKPTNKNAEGVIITGQTDYWDSINITPDGKGMYGKVEKNIAVSDFLRQLKPSGFKAQTAAPELPYSLLRRGDGYEIRRYPSYTAVEIPYGRRDEGFGTLGSFTNGTYRRNITLVYTRTRPCNLHYDSVCMCVFDFPCACNRTSFHAKLFFTKNLQLLNICLSFFSWTTRICMCIPNTRTNYQE